MSDGATFDSPREESAYRPPVSRSSQKPKDGRCQCCRRFVSRAGLVWDHCHHCGDGRGWCCDDCNTALTEHLIEHLGEARSYLDGHRCGNPALFEMRRDVPMRDRSQVTRPVFLNNGSDDGRVVQVSRHHGWFSIEQVAVVCGVSTPTARDFFNGRRGVARMAKRADNGTWLVPAEELLALVQDRIERGLQ